MERLTTRTGLIPLVWLRLSAASLIVLCLLAADCGKRKHKTPPSANFLIEARKAISAGDTATALDALTQSIESKPNTWAYFERSKLHLKQGDEPAALADCESALQIEPGNKDILWLQKEIKKPALKRFKGLNKLPPSFRK